MGRSCNFYNLLLECGISPAENPGVRQWGISPHCRGRTGTKSTTPGTGTEQPRDALRPFATEKHFALSAITYFCLEKDSPSKAAPKSVLIQPSLKASSCRHSQVLTPALISYCCLIFGISSATSAAFFLFFLFFFPLFSSECSKSGFSSSHDF